MKVKIKKLNEAAKIPSYSKTGDAGMDFTSISKNVYPDYTEYRTGLAVKIPDGHLGLIFPRSSISNKDLRLTNSVGVVDSGYTGEISFRFKREEKNNGRPLRDYEVGDRIGQLIIIPFPKVEWEETDDLGTTERGNGGFGSTDNKTTVIEKELIQGLKEVLEHKNTSKEAKLNEQKK